MKLRRKLRERWMTCSVWSLFWKSIYSPLSHAGEKPCKFGVNIARMKSNLIHTDSHRREAFPCKFCGKITSPKFNLKKHTPIIHTEVKPLPACFVATSTVWTKTSRSILRWTILEWGPSLQVFWQVRRKTWRSIFRCSMQERSHFLQFVWQYNHF